MKRTIITVTAMVFLLLTVSIGVAIYRTLPYVSGDLDKAYTRMVKEQVIAHWECTQAADREQFMLSLIDRFAPEDIALIKQGRIWKDELKAKEKAGTLTVSERDRLYSGYYYDMQDKYEHSINVRTGSFSKPICGDVKCSLPYMAVTEKGLVYEDAYSRWTMNEYKWKEAIEEEFIRLNKRKVSRFVSRYQKKKAERLKEVRENVLGLPASKVPKENVEGMIAEEYLKLSCL